MSVASPGTRRRVRGSEAQRLSLRPVRAEVRFGIAVRPLIKYCRQRGRLPASCWQVPLEHEYQHDVTLRSEVVDVLGNYSSAVGASRRRDVRIVSCLQASLTDMDGVVAVLLAEQ